MRFHLFPFRTEKLSSLTPMVLRFSRGRVGSRLFKVRSKGLTFFRVRMYRGRAVGAVRPRPANAGGAACRGSCRTSLATVHGLGLPHCRCSERGRYGRGYRCSLSLAGAGENGPVRTETREEGTRSRTQKRKNPRRKDRKTSRPREQRRCKTMRMKRAARRNTHRKERRFLWNWRTRKDE